jgi:hypothetical protein
MAAYKNVALSCPLLSRSQVRFRLELAQQRTRSYPLDSMDFVMMDLERPEGHHRHAYQCTGDLTGRLLEFLSHAEGVDGRHDPRLPELFERILRQRRPSGLLGRILADPMIVHECFSACARFFPGFIYYYELTHDIRAIDAAIGLAEHAIRHKDIWHKRAKETGGRAIELWITEPMAMLHGILGRQEYLDFVGMINDTVEMPDRGAHAHGYMAMLRGLQTAALITGDASWNTKPEAARRMIIERHFELPDGCTPECFPHSGANEGCSIADWLMLNLNTAAIAGDDDAYEHAEHILWNALAFNQWNTGCFGVRSTSPSGYSMRRFEEAWWCCLHHGGLALVEYARHAVTLRERTIQVNLLVPGLYRVALAGGREAEVRIATAYPARAETFISAAGLPEGVSLRLRVPACARQAVVTETRDSDRVHLKLSGRLGHHVVSCHGGVMLKYGPLVVAPAIYSWQGEGNGCYTAAASETRAPTGYIPESMPTGLPLLELPAPDAEGLLELSDLPRPEWMYFDEGETSRCGVEGSAANVPVRFPDGTRKALRFTPLCYNTSCLSLFDTPIIFGGSEHPRG